MSVDVVGLRALAEKATPGPWMYIAHHTQGDWTGAGRGVVHQIHPDNLAIAGNAADAQLIEAAVNALPALLDEITTLRAENERLTTLAQSYAQKNPWIARAESAEAALADRDARITAALKLHNRGPTMYASAQGLVSTDDDHIPDGCDYCQVPWPCLTVRTLSALAVPVPQDNPEHDEEWVLEIGKRNERVYEAVREETGLITTNAWTNALVWRTVEFVLDVRPKNGEKP